MKENQPEKKGARITLKNIKGFIQGNLRKIQEDLLGLPLEGHVREQIEWRLKQVAEKSPECLKNKECYCGCTMPNKLYEDRGCEGSEYGSGKPPCYPDMMDKEAWESFKKTNQFVKIINV